MKAKPDSVEIFGIRYLITYCDKPSDVDIFRRESFWGQIDYWTRTIRVYDNNTTPEDIWDTIIHEVLHGIISALKIRGKIEDCKEGEDIVGLLALGLQDVMFRNGWIRLDEKPKSARA
ncbi:MAG: hypothetical protein IMZ54_07820 [Acidobacteria bacterium]|nr:hypothetical protein [Acidobacteriota bacterium]